MERVNSLIRIVMTLVGSFLIGGGIKFFGHDIDDAYWSEITGVILAGVSLYWSIKSREVNIEKQQTLARQIVVFVCGIMVAKGILSEQQSLAIGGFVVAIIQYIYAGLSRKKNDQLQQGIISPHQLKSTNK